ncbi:unnamed protein product [Paramecium pentaurelia]|uniref:Uncharacterized protein n=1 Tax=Paramecium pentaurelia TaxID=43138 RepID=A0A8S1YNU3_9CILI|nr:unnamed protein product [Paramecium pentaurelia]
MNILSSQIQQQKHEIREMVCQIHKLEVVAVDLETYKKVKFQYMYCDCLVEKINNNKISIIDQTKERIQSFKTQKQQNKTKQIENTLEKIYSQIKAQIFTIQQEKQSLLENN